MNTKTSILRFLLSLMVHISTVVLCHAATIIKDGSRLWLRLDTNNVAADITGDGNIVMKELKSYSNGQPIELKRNQHMNKYNFQIIANDKRNRVQNNNDMGVLHATYHILRLQQLLLLMDILNGI